MSLPRLKLKKGEDRRIRMGHAWIFSNEINTTVTPLKSFTAGQEVEVEAADGTLVGIAYINPQSLIAGRIFSRDPKDRLSVDFFRRRIETALNLRKRLFNEPYYRLVYSEGDHLPGIVIDRFDNDFVIQVNTAGMELQIEMIVQALQSTFPNIRSVLLKNESHMRAHEGLQLYTKAAYGEPPQEITLQENGVQFAIPLWKGQKTGWFYDHRENRARLKAYVADKSVLDVFSYVGGWGIEAAVFGAKSVECIEASAPACDYIRKNAALNQVEEKVSVICGDAFDALKSLQQANKRYDVIILDPPAFIKKLKDRKEGFIAYQRLNEMALKLLNPYGLLISCSCSMHLTTDDLMQIMQRISFNTNQRIHLLERGHQGPDHPIHISIPETEYLKAVVVRKLSD